MKTINKNSFFTAIFLLVFCVAACGYDNEDKDLIPYSLDKDTKMKFIPLKPGTTTAYTAEEIKQVKATDKYDPYQENKYKLSQNVTLRIHIANFELKKFEILDNSNQDKVIHAVTKATKQGENIIISLSKTMKELGFEKKSDGTFNIDYKRLVFRVTYQNGILDFYKFKVSAQK